ncbi:MAG: hypothetical protein ACI9TY_001196 [Alphaproteobacteria bacterium]|jgi:hypothetical protein
MENTITPLRHWHALLNQPVLHRSGVMIARLREIYKSLNYIHSIKNEENKVLPAQWIKAINRPYGNKDSALHSLKTCKNKASLVLAYVENAIIFKPENWSNNKWKEAQHYIADNIQYIIEDIEKEIAKLG